MSYKPGFAMGGQEETHIQSLPSRGSQSGGEQAWKHPQWKPQGSVQRKEVKSLCRGQEGHLRGGAFVLSLEEEVLDKR